MSDDLETLVRETRPEPRPEFVERLGRRVDGGFAAGPKPVTPRGGVLGPLLAVAATFLVALVVVGVVSSGSGVDGGDEGSAGAGGGGSSGEAMSVAPRGADPTRGARGGAAPPGTGARRVDRRVTLALAAGAEDFTRVSDGVIAVSDDVGGVVQRSTVSERDGRGFARFDLRIPAGRLDDALADLSRLANVRSRTAATEDVTGATVSARDRLADARAERAGVLRALEDAPSAGRAAELRARLRILRARIAREAGRVRALERRAALATVRVTVESTDDAGAWTPGDAARDAGRVLEVALGVALVALAVLGPLALLAALAAGAGRVARRRRREAVLG